MTLSPIIEGRRALTDRQQLCLTLIERHVEANGFAPTLRWLGEQMKIGSTNGVSDHLLALERKGYISRRGGLARGMVILRRPDSIPPPASERAELLDRTLLLAPQGERGGEVRVSHPRPSVCEDESLVPICTQHEIRRTPTE
jgi:repressor LexA